MKALLLATVLVLAAPQAIASCGSTSFTLSGVVLQHDGNPASGALVGAAWKEDGLIGGPALGTTDADGRYTIRILFSGYSHNPEKGWYDCTGQLSEVIVSAYAAPHYSPPEPIEVETGVSQISAGPLTLSFDIQTGVPIER